MDKSTKRNLCFTDDIGSGGGSHKKNHIGEVVGITISAAVIILGLVVIFWKKRKLLSISNVKAGPRGNAPPYNVKYMV